MHNWTRPYYGVTHLNGLVRRTQVTACDRSEYCDDGSGFADCYVLVMYHGDGFYTQVAEQDFRSPDKERAIKLAKEWGEAKAMELHLIKD